MGCSILKLVIWPTLEYYTPWNIPFESSVSLQEIFETESSVRRVSELRQIFNNYDNFGQKDGKDQRG